MMKEEQRSYIFDTSVLVEIMGGTRLGRVAYDLLLRGGVDAFISEIHVAELKYVICRKQGFEKSKTIVEKLLKSGYVHVLPISDFIDRAAKIKCERAISLVDAFTIALGEELGLTVVFAKLEKELKKEVEKKPFETTITTIEKLAEQAHSNEHL
ncbi:MAG: PIN domain nuclease [Thermoprotei archaeon]|nr:MAG: PIN domain nuclease [Thermoprotei archaeon]